MKNEILLRLAEVKDLVAMTALSSQLGYENSTQILMERFTELQNSQEHVFIVAEQVLSKAVVGLAYFKKHRSLFVESSLEVGGLVVDELYRGRGIGRLFMAKAEEIARDWQLSSVRLTSNIKRTEAHEFYRSLGYEQPKTSHFFIKKNLAGSSG